MSVLLGKIRDIPSQPCCGYFLHGGTRVVGLIDFGLALFAMILIGSELYQKFEQLEDLWQKGEKFKYYFRAASWISYFTFKLTILSLSILLFKAAKKRSARLCKIWMISSSATNVCMFVVFYVNHYLFNISATVHIFGFFYVIYKLYCLHVVWSFVKELQSYGGFNAALSGLTDAEVEEFEKGCPPDRVTKSDQGFTIQNQAFNKDFEILKENLQIDESSLLGSGAFGCVYRGKLTTNTGTNSVAVKTVNSNADVAYFKTLLGELKVMTFLSHHENVVSLLGACTADIKQKKLYVVVEFCPYGNLHEYLKARRGMFMNFVKDGEIRADVKSMGNMYTNVNAGNTVTTLDLLKWVCETSKGLEFLEEKKVIHGDIAARNILLGYGKIAKISDFGLAKKLYQYTTIVKEATLLPWRWMALESLIDMEFSTKSDVWSFSTTMWETFSLSELPFPGFSWDKDFINKLHEGLRMKQPKNATNEVYELMLKCWQPDPSNRPSFQELRQELERLLDEAQLKVGQSNSSNENGTSISAGELPKFEDDELEIYVPNQAFLEINESEV